MSVRPVSAASLVKARSANSSKPSTPLQQSLNRLASDVAPIARMAEAGKVASLLPFGATVTGLINRRKIQRALTTLQQIKGTQDHATNSFLRLPADYLRDTNSHNNWSIGLGIVPLLGMSAAHDTLMSQRATLNAIDTIRTAVDLNKGQPLSEDKSTQLFHLLENNRNMQASFGARSGLGGGVADTAVGLGLGAGLIGIAASIAST